MKSLTIVCLIMVSLMASSCNSSNNSYSADNEIDIILPENNADESEFVKHIKNIEIINLQMDSNYVYTDVSDLRVSDNYYYFISRGLQLTCYEKATGKLMFSRSVMGRGHGECAQANSYFTSGDNIVINAQGRLLSYNCFGDFCGSLTNKELGSTYILPLKDGYVSCELSGSLYDMDRCVTLLDSSFNEKGNYFKIPSKYKLFGRYHISSTSPNIYVFNDTLRFIYQFTYRLYSFPEGKTYHFISPKQIPKAEVDKLSDVSGLHDFINSLEDIGCNTTLIDLAEVQNYITFRYLTAGLQEQYKILIDKRNNDVFSIRIERDDYETSLDVWAVMLGSQVLYCDGKYLYAKAHRNAYKFLDRHAQCLDSMQMSVYKTMQEKLSATTERDFSFFYKIELE